MAREKICGIYIIHSPTDRIYIGQSRDIMIRFKSYLCGSSKTKGQPKLHNSFVKHGVENHFFTVLEECELLQLNIRERFWQDEHNAIGDMGLNCRLTETDLVPAITSEETRKKLSEAAVKRMSILLNDPEYKKTMRIAYDKKIGVKLRPKTDEEKEAIRKKVTAYGGWKGEKNPFYGKDRYGENNSMFGKVQSEETRDKIRQKALGRKHTDSAKSLMSAKRSLGNNIHAKLVFNEETGIFYTSGKEAWMAIGYGGYPTMKSKLNGDNPNKTSYRYV